MIEIMVAFSLLSMLIMTLFTFYFYGVNSFLKGSSHSDLQQNVRVAADFIARELMFAENVVLYQENEIRYKKPGDEHNYTLKQKGKEIVLIINLTESKVAYNIDDLIFSLDATLLQFEIIGSEGESFYSFNSTLRLKNM